MGGLASGKNTRWNRSGLNWRCFWKVLKFLLYNGGQDIKKLVNPLFLLNFKFIEEMISKAVYMDFLVYFERKLAHVKLLEEQLLAAAILIGKRKGTNTNLHLRSKG